MHLLLEDHEGVRAFLLLHYQICCIYHYPYIAFDRFWFCCLGWYLLYHFFLHLLHSQIRFLPLLVCLHSWCILERPALEPDFYLIFLFNDPPCKCLGYIGVSRVFPHWWFSSLCMCYSDISNFLDYQCPSKNYCLFGKYICGSWRIRVLLKSRLL